MHTDLHRYRHVEEPMKILEGNLNGYIVKEHPGRMQPYTVWKNEHVVKFFETFDEVLDFVSWGRG